MSRSSIALSNLRAIVIIIVLAFHSVLAYLSYLPTEPYAFDKAPYRWQAIPIIDGERWFGFDLFCAWQDVSLMSLMFFLSGVFVPTSLARKGGWTFLSDRFLRIGLPLLFVVVAVMPLAYYPAYRVGAADPGIGAFWQHWSALPFWPSGPQWFLCQLLVLNVLAAGLHRVAPGAFMRLGRLAEPARDNSLKFFVALCAVSAVAYVPLALIYSPWDWINSGPFSFQISRPLHYLVYFLAGSAAGACGLDRGLLASDGSLARNWAAWCGGAFAGFIVWALPTAETLDGRQAPLAIQLASDLGFVVACAAGGFAFLAVCLRFATTRRRIFDSLSANAYNMYLNHYVFMVWLQFAMLNVGLIAFAKALVVFGGTLALSWACAVALGGLSLGAFVSQLKRWQGAEIGRPRPAEAVKRDELVR